MAEIAIKPGTKTRPAVERSRLCEVILLTDAYTPREFVVTVLKAEFRMNEDQAHRVMITARPRGVSVVAVCMREVAEANAKHGTKAGRSRGCAKGRSLVPRRVQCGMMRSFARGPGA